MKIISNPKKIERYHKIGMYTSLGSLLLLFGAVAMTLMSLNNPQLSTLSFFPMMAGLVLSQVGVFFANRWGKSPRIDERLSAGLKGLDDRYSLYHYTAPVPHLLVGPSGLWLLVPQYQAGAITYEKGRFRQTGVSFLSRVIGQEGIGRPEQEARSLYKDLEGFLKKRLPEGEDLPPIRPVIVFTSPKASVQVEDTPFPTLHVEKLKDLVRRKTKEQPPSLQIIQQVKELLPEENVS